MQTGIKLSIYIYVDLSRLKYKDKQCLIDIILLSVGKTITAWVSVLEKYVFFFVAQNRDVFLVKRLSSALAI